MGNMIGRVWEKVSAGWLWVLSKIQEAVNYVRKKLNDMANAVKRFYDNFTETLKDRFSRAKSALQKSVQKLVQKMAEAYTAAKETVSWLYTATKETVSSLVSLVKGFFRGKEVSEFVEVAREVERVTKKKGLFDGWAFFDELLDCLFMLEGLWELCSIVAVIAKPVLRILFNAVYLWLTEPNKSVGDLRKMASVYFENDFKATSFVYLFFAENLYNDIAT